MVEDNWKLSGTKNLVYTKAEGSFSRKDRVGKGFPFPGMKRFRPFCEKTGLQPVH